MLLQLNISNYALIEKSTIAFPEGMTVITGETGAGKSIMLGAIGLLIGNRADLQVLKNKEQKCVVEAVFDISTYGLKDLFVAEDVDYDEQTIVRREILPTGKSRAFVNDQPVNVSFLKSLGSHLVDVHSQHQNLLLSDDTFQLSVVDTVSKSESELTKYTSQYDVYQQLVQRERGMVEENNRMKKDLDYMQFQLEELTKLKLQTGEDVDLEAEQERLANAETIKAGLAESMSLLDNSDQAIIPALRQVENLISKIEKYLPIEANATQRISSARIDIEDLMQTMSVVTEGLDVDSSRLDFVESRLNSIFALEKKHGVDSVNSLIALRDELQRKVGQINNFDEELEELRKHIEDEKKLLSSLADDLSKKRQSAFRNIEEYVVNVLRDMGMRNAIFTISHNRTDNYSKSGNDEIHFLFAANLGGEPTDISKVASGGEMSRVMLSIKSLLSASRRLPTIIFDEIDTGVSGDVADKMGSIMTQMGENMQVIAITHLPQVAAKGESHFQVYKEDSDNVTVSRIRQLTNAERTDEIAKMLSGARITEAALANARQLLGF
ncbi:MAG: DNA repair protein RecN [Marinilabiliaceae bacterium]|nr:DNA repair protein RecN [Marinilabiliaceae bacterium]